MGRKGRKEQEDEVRDSRRTFQHPASDDIDAKRRLWWLHRFFSRLKSGMEVTTSSKVRTCVGADTSA